MKRRKAREILHCFVCGAGVDVTVYPMALEFHLQHPKAKAFPYAHGAVGMFHNSPDCGGTLTHFREVLKRKAKR